MAFGRMNQIFDELAVVEDCLLQDLRSELLRGRNELIEIIPHAINGIDRIALLRLQSLLERIEGARKFIFGLFVLLEEIRIRQYLEGINAQIRHIIAKKSLRINERGQLIPFLINGKESIATHGFLDNRVIAGRGFELNERSLLF